MAKRQPPSKDAVSSRQIERETHAQRAEKAAGIPTQQPQESLPLVDRL
jgi:hypothetical protein